MIQSFYSKQTAERKYTIVFPGSIDAAACDDSCNMCSMTIIVIRGRSFVYSVIKACNAACKVMMRENSGVNYGSAGDCLVCIGGKVVSRIIGGGFYNHTIVVIHSK